MKLSLIEALAVGALGVSLITGCAGSAQSAAPSTPVGTASLTSASVTPSTPSTLAPAAWEAEATSSAAPVVQAAPLPTWGAAVTASSVTFSAN